MSASSQQEIYDVAIVGFGPSGAIAAGLLGKKGIRTFVCDKLGEVYDKPRAIALDHEILRVFQQMGLTEKIKPFIEPFTDSVYYGVDGQVIKRMSTVATPYPLAHNPSVVFTQPPVEKILREYAQSHESVRVELGATLSAIEQDANSTTLSLRHGDGRSTKVTAKYAIGCDGASSSLRGFVGIELEDLGFDEPWLVIDVLVNERGLAKLPKTSVQYCNPKRPSTYVIGPGNHRRWEISINEGEDPAELTTPKGTWSLLAPWLNEEEGTLWRQASYRFHALVAKQWRVGRVFLAGDCAHQQPPFLGQGMCQGVRDVVSLCWRLEAVLKGEAKDTLLDSYGAERKAHVMELTTRIKGIGKIITERDVEKARGRDAKLLADCGGVVSPTPRQDVQPALSAGLLGSIQHPARGTIFPQPLIKGAGGESVRMDEVHPAGWMVVLSENADDAFIQSCKNHHLPILKSLKLATPELAELEGVLRHWFDRHGAQAAIVRPDHYIFGVCKTPQDLSLQLDELRLA